MKKRYSYAGAFVAMLLLAGCAASSGSHGESIPEETVEAADDVESRTESTEEMPAALGWGDYATLFYEEPWSDHTAEEWLQDGNTLAFPHDIYDLKQAPQWPSEEWFAYYHVPQEALTAANTESLLQAVADFGSAYFWGKGCYIPDWWDYMRRAFNGTEELMARKDFVEAVLTRYEEETYMPLLADSLDEEEAAAYKEQMHRQTQRVITEEMLLATDEAFEQADAETRSRILEAVQEKAEYLQNEEYDISTYPAFLAYVVQNHAYAEGSKWYDFIMEESTAEELKTCMEEMGETTYW